MFLEHNSQLSFYRLPFGAVTCGTEVTLRLSVSGAGIPHSVRCIISEDAGDEQTLDMAFVFEAVGASIYSCTVIMPSQPQLMWYYFVLEYDGGTVYYGNNPLCLGGTGESSEEVPVCRYQITVYDKEYKTPEWFRESVAYQIFPDRFFNGNQNGDFCLNRNGIIKHEWGEMPYYKSEQFGGDYLSNDFFGGNLKGIMEKLPYLKELGVSVIYLNPVFKAYSNHRYDTGDYETIDPILGTEEDFSRLCSEAGKLGIRIILDGVFNHTGSNSKYFNKNGEYDSIGAYQSESSPYRDWFRFGKTRDDYECWWGMKTLPHTEETSKSFQDYIACGENSIIKKWLRLGASGWRLDVVDELPDFFVRLLRENAKAVYPEAVMIGEVWEDASNKISYGERRGYFLGDELDSVMNYPLRSAVIDAALMRIDAPEFSKRLMSLKENYPPQAFNACLNMVSSHDVERIFTLMGGVPKPADKDEQAEFRLLGEAYELASKRALLVAALQMTLPGVPCIYYGDEIGMEGFADPFCRGSFDWSRTENNVFAEQYKVWVRLRNETGALKRGEFEPVYAIGPVFGFIRYTEAEKYIIIANFSSEFEKIRLDAGRFGAREIKSVLGEEHRTSPDGIYWIDMPEHWVKVFAVQ
ncbi:MAG: glycoside hydrolase family 13 protein [Clostridia bacterium]|nr:glycoside hydrolase family 13 protein [Clostridia bacterium]